MFEAIALVVVVGTTIWVVADAIQLSGATQGRYRVGNQPHWVWAVGCLALWIIFFPLYLAARSAFVREIR